MPSLRGQTPAENGGGFTAADFYSASKATVYPSYTPRSPREAGTSKYATPELEAAARPYADIGKVDLNLFDPGGGNSYRTTMPGDDQGYTTPAQPGAHEVMGAMQLPWMNKEKGESLAGVPGAGIVGGGIDFLSNIAGQIPSTPTLPAQQVFDRLKTTPDEQLSPEERQLKSLHSGLFGRAPDSPMMQGKQVGELYKQYQIMEAHKRGESAMLNPLPGTMGPMDFGPIGQALQAYNFLSNGFRRVLGSGGPLAALAPEDVESNVRAIPIIGGALSFGSGDQLKELTKPGVTQEEIGEERWQIKEQLESGEINEDEARDLIALSSFALSNPDPVKWGDEWGPVDTIANAGLALLGETVSDPLTIPAVAATGGGYLAKTPIQVTLKSATRSIAREIVETAGKDLATAAGQEAYEAAIKQVTREASDLAAQQMGKGAMLRHLPKDATVLAKQTGKVAEEHVTDMDRLEALLSMGAENHPWSGAISRGIDAAGTQGFMAVRAPKLIKAGQAIDKMVDPFSLFGYWRTGRTVPMALSKQAAHGAYDAIGWRVARRLDGAYADAGVDAELASRSRNISFANHTVQAGDRANTQRLVNTNSSFTSGMNPTEAALQHASRREGDIRQLVRTQVDRTLEFIVPAGKGGRAAAEQEWRVRAARQLQDMGATVEDATRVAADMDERMMRALANDHYGYIIDTLDAAKRGSIPTAKLSQQGIDRVTFMGVHQMSTQALRAVREAVKGNQIDIVRTAVHRFDTLSRTVSESLTDAELLVEVERVLAQLDGKLPTAIEDMADMPTELVDWARAHPGYQLMLRPDDDNLLVPIRNADGRITSVETWIDHVTERTPAMQITRMKSWREGLLRGVAGGEIERNAYRRFASNMAEYAGLSEVESKSVMRAVREAAEAAQTGPRGLTSDQIIRAVDNAKISPERKVLAKREVIDSLFEAYENEARLVGATPKLTGWVKKQGSAVGSNALGWLTDFLYPAVRFSKNPLFFLQEVPEAAFFLSLMGRYPISGVVPDPVARTLASVPVPGVRQVGEAIAKSKENTRVWNAKTQVLMDAMTRSSPNAEYDFFEASELVRMGLTVAGAMTERRTALGKLLAKAGFRDGSALNVRKMRSVAMATRYELGEQWKRSLQKNAPEQWLAVRTFYPDEMSDGEVAVQWALDTMARADPDSIYATNAPGLFMPSHIGRRAEVSDHLVRRFVYGDDATASRHTWDDLVGEVREGTVSIDHVRRELMSAGADPDYVERAVTRLTFGTADEFYRAANDLGISEDATEAWRASNKIAADLQGISETEYLSRTFVGRPMHTDQMGNTVGETLFDDIVESMRVRGKNIPASDSQEVADLKEVSRQMIEGVFPTSGRWQDVIPERKGAPVPGYKTHFNSGDDVAPDYFELPSAGRTMRDMGGNAGDMRSVQVTDDQGKVVGAVFGKLDEETNTIQIMQSVTLEDHQRKGLANWMYRELEEKTGATVVQTADQTPNGRAFWSQENRPFGPRQRTQREFQTGIENGRAVTVGEREMADPKTLPDVGTEVPEEYWPPDIDTFNDPKLEKMEPIRLTDDGRYVSRDDRARAQVALERNVRAPVQRYAYPDGGQTQREAQKAASKVRGWMRARDDRQANPFMGAPPSRNINPQVEPARFGTDARGNATVPDVFESKPGYVYRTVRQNRLGSDWRVGEFAAKHPAAMYAEDDTFVVSRVREDITQWEEASGGVMGRPGENIRAKTTIPASAVEVLGADGKWHPALAPSGYPEPLYQTDLHTVGMLTPEQYRRQIVTMMDPVAMQKRGMRAMTEKDALQAIEWYDHIRRAQFALVDESLSPEQRVQEAARLLIAFGTTQLNTSPADGFRHVFKSYGMRARGETLQLDEARNIVQQAVGLNPEQLQNLVWGRGQKIEQMGIAQKLFDFIDSLTGSKTRTNGVTGPRGDWGPVAVDIHTKRDFGFLDEAMGDWVYRLVEREGPGGEIVHGVKSRLIGKGKGFEVQMSDGTTEIIDPQHVGAGVPTDHEYDYGVELANDIRDHFNETKFMGREWSSYEVQALGWYRMQLLKSSEGDAGEVANALFEQSRWMGSNDLVPSPHAPLHEVHPWDAVAPQYHRAIHVEGAYHASDEAEMMSGANVLTKMDSDAVVGGTYRPAQTVELMTDPTGAEQYLAHYLLLSEQDSGVLMRDYVGKTSTPDYKNGVGISVDIPARDADHAKELLQLLAGEEGGALNAIGSHTFIARASDGSFHLRTLWEPRGPKADRNAFNRALKQSGLTEKLAEEGVVGRDSLVDFVSLKHDWKADPTGKTYMDVIQRGSGKHGVMRTGEQREALVRTYDEAYDRARQRLTAAEAAATRTAEKASRKNASQASIAEAESAAKELKAATKAVEAAKKEMEVARAAPGGRSASDVSELVGSARLRVRETVRAGFDKYASREVRNERERVLGEARDAAGDALGTDPKWDDVLALGTGSNGERLFERTPNGTVRAAVTRSATADRRVALHLNRASVTDKSLLHELIHVGAWEMDDSAVRTIKGVFKGLEGTPFGTHTPGTPLTEAEHEWLVGQFMLWVENADSVHPVLQPLMQHYRGKLGSIRTLRTQATGPSREAIKRIDGEIATLQTTLARPGISQRTRNSTLHALTAKTAERAEAVRGMKAIRGAGGLSPEVKTLLDDIASKSGGRTETRASTYNADEANMMEWSQISMAAAQKRANDLVHMRGERSALERSINHPFLMMYPTSYMYGKVLPYMAEFLMARPFGMKAPFLAYTMGNSMHQSFQRQQQYDPELRNFLYKNEPFLRAMSMFVPGLPWDLPSGMPFWARRIAENWMTNANRRMNGEPEEDIDILGLIAESAQYQMTLRGTDSIGPIWDAVKPFKDGDIDPTTGKEKDWNFAIPKAGEIVKAIASGEAPQPGVPQPPQP